MFGNRDVPAVTFVHSVKPCPTGIILGMGGYLGKVEGMVGIFTSFGPPSFRRLS